MISDRQPSQNNFTMEIQVYLMGCMDVMDSNETPSGI